MKSPRQAPPKSTRNSAFRTERRYFDRDHAIGLSQLSGVQIRMSVTSSFDGAFTFAKAVYQRGQEAHRIRRYSPDYPYIHSEIERIPKLGFLGTGER